MQVLVGRRTVHWLVPSLRGGDKQEYPANAHFKETAMCMFISRHVIKYRLLAFHLHNKGMNPHSKIRLSDQHYVNQTHIMLSIARKT